MQMYDGLPIITNKITVEEQQGVPHHLLGFIALDEEPWRVGLFKKKASNVIQEIRSRGRLPIIVGGTHYYTQSLLFEDSLVNDQVDGGDQVPTELSNQDISDKFPILDGPTETMIERLREVDPVMADRWHPNDRRKIRRSLEIFLLTGKRASDVYAEQLEIKSSNRKMESAEEGPSQSISDTLLFWVHSDSEVLKNRLDNRVDKMVKAGLLDEVKSMDEFLHKRKRDGITVDRSRGIWASIGWKEFEQYLAALETGAESQPKLETLYDVSIEQVKAATRQYAKRQTRWIRLKLIPELSDQNALENLYLLDGSDLTLWADNVSHPAMGIVESFLAGGELCAPSEMSNAAKQFLAPEGMSDSAERRGLSTRRECNVCNMVSVREDQWQSHLKSRRHRQLVKKSLKDASGMSSLPKNDSKSALPETP